IVPRATESRGSGEWVTLGVNTDSLTLFRIDPLRQAVHAGGVDVARRLGRRRPVLKREDEGAGLGAGSLERRGPAPDGGDDPVVRGGGQRVNQVHGKLLAGVRRAEGADEKVPTVFIPEIELAAARHLERRRNPAGFNQLRRVLARIGPALDGL